MALLERRRVQLQEGERHLRVMQWNVLADQLSDAFPRVDSQWLQWPHREPLIKAEIDRADADIIVVEELDHYADCLQPYLTSKGYTGLYQQKGDWHHDGIAVFCRSARVTVERSEVVGYEGESQFFTVMECRCVATGTCFVVVATHLKAKADFEAVRVRQAQQLLTALEKYGSTPLIVCGDFNSPPTREVYALFAAFPLRSAYFDSLSPGEPLFTSLKYRDKLYSYTIDYVWTRGWTCLAVLGIPTEEEIGGCGLPAEKYPSDHFSLVCDLAFQQ